MQYRSIPAVPVGRIPNPVAKQEVLPCSRCGVRRKSRPGTVLCQDCRASMGSAGVRAWMAS